MDVHTLCWVVNTIDPNVILDEESIIRHLKDVFNLNLLSRLQKFVLVIIIISFIYMVSISLTVLGALNITLSQQMH